MYKRKRKADAIANGEETLEESKNGDDVKLARASRDAYTNKQRVLILASRGITARYRYLLEDLKKLIPHHKKDSKLDSKNDVQSVNEIAEIKSCNQSLYLECRKRQDLYMYLGRTPNGPSAKFHVVNVHTMDELKLTGNCMLGSRPLLNFDSKFDSAPHWQLMRRLLGDCFGTPLGHPKSKPFVDRIMSFMVVKNNIWVRNFQIVDKTDSKESSASAKVESHLVEIGPRMVLIPIRIFSGSLGGVTLYQNAAYVSPNTERAALLKRKANAYEAKQQRMRVGKERKEDYVTEYDELEGLQMFKGED
jgi:ribosome biogenesis protein BRX1